MLYSSWFLNIFAQFLINVILNLSNTIQFVNWGMLFDLWVCYPFHKMRKSELNHMFCFCFSVCICCFILKLGKRESSVISGTVIFKLTCLRKSYFSFQIFHYIIALKMVSLTFQINNTAIWFPYITLDYSVASCIL